MENHQNSSAHKSLFPFDLIVVVMDVCKRWLLILFAVILVGVSTYIVCDLTYQPQYKTTTTFVVTSKSASSTVFTNLNSTSSLASVFSDLLNSSLLRKSILSELGQSSFDGTIQAEVINETNLLTVTVTASDARTAFLVAQAIIDHHEDVTYQVVDDIVLEVLQHPAVPVAPVNSANAFGRMKQAMLLAAVAAAVLLAMASYSRDTVRSGQEARAKLDGNYLGELPHEKKYRTLLSWLRRQKSGILITNPLTSFRFVETLRKLRSRLEQRLHGRKALMVTSFLENEGKSTVAVNLALSLAQKHSKVLLIDCDLRKPACHILLERKDVTCGLRNILTGKSTVQEALLLDKKSKLYMILETRASSGSSDLLNSLAMQELLQWAREEFDYIILDLPPMAQISDAESMTRFADASMLVVRQNTAVTPALNKAIAALESGNAKFLGSVLNNVYSSKLSSGRSYGYGYGHYGRYGHYGTSGTANEE